jgi:chromate transport protein ChrA
MLNEIRTFILRFASILHVIGLFILLSECPRIDGGLSFFSGLVILIISLASGLCIWLMSTSYSKKFRLRAYAALVPSAVITLLMAEYYSPYLFWCAVLVVVLAFYEKPKELTNLPKVIFRF